MKIAGDNKQEEEKLEVKEEPIVDTKASDDTKKDNVVKSQSR